MRPIDSRGGLTRTEANDRLRRLTIGTTVASLLATASFSGMAAISSVGSETTNTTTVVSDTSSTADESDSDADDGAVSAPVVALGRGSSRSSHATSGGS